MTPYKEITWGCVWRTRLKLRQSFLITLYMCVLVLVYVWFGLPMGTFAWSSCHCVIILTVLANIQGGCKFSVNLKGLNLPIEKTYENFIFTTKQSPISRSVSCACRSIIFPAVLRGTQRQNLECCSDGWLGYATMSVGWNWLYRGCVSCHQGSVHCVPVATCKKDLEIGRTFCSNLVFFNYCYYCSSSFHLTTGKI